MLILFASLAFSLLPSGAFAAAFRSLEVVFDPATHTASITGSLTSGEFSTITISVTDPAGTVIYMNDASSQADGSFAAHYKLPSDAVEGVYRVRVGGNGISSLQTRTFAVGELQSRIAGLRSIHIDGVALEGFDPDDPAYTVHAEEEVSSIFVTAIVEQSGGALKINGTPGSDGAAFGPVALAVGPNRILIETVSVDGTHAKSYSVTVIRAGDAPPPSGGDGDGDSGDGGNDGNTGNTGNTGNNSDAGSDVAVASSADQDHHANAALAASADGKVDATLLAKAFAANKEITITSISDFLILPASALTDAAKESGAALTADFEHGRYTLPLSVLKLDDLATALGETTANISIQVTASKVSGAAAAVLHSTADSAGMRLLADAVDFNVTAVGKAGKPEHVDFGGTYVTRILQIDGAVDPLKATGVLYNPVTQSFRFVPTTFETKDGKTSAVLKHNGSGIYTVVSFSRSFTDISSQWAKADIQMLANKLVVDGMTDKTFAPDSSITRAQFTALLVRALGLDSTDSGVTPFRDVKADAWYAGVVSAAVRAGLVQGADDNRFLPDSFITREELAALIVRAMKYAGMKADVSTTEQASLLAAYTDSGDIGWAKAEMATVLDKGIMDGVTDNTLAPGKEATRAESATMLKRLLINAGFINETI